MNIKLTEEATVHVTVMASGLSPRRASQPRVSGLGWWSLMRPLIIHPMLAPFQSPLGTERFVFFLLGSLSVICAHLTIQMNSITLI